MPTTIYYFTGTGNSLHVARAIAEKLGDAKVMNIARLKKDAIEDKSDTVGIVFPVFYANPPNIVKDFVKRLRLDPKAYVFAVGTCGGRDGNTFSTMDKLLAKNGSHLSAAFKLKMTDNAYIGINLVTPPEERDAVYKASEEGLNKIIESLKNREATGKKINYQPGLAIGAGLASFFAADIYRLPRRFKSTEKCNGCGICQKLCPMGNITRVDKKVTWGNNCTQCLACFHWCPRTAIEIGSKSTGIARYHHPDIKLADMTK